MADPTSAEAQEATTPRTPLDRDALAFLELGKKAEKDAQEAMRARVNEGPQPETAAEADAAAEEVVDPQGELETTSEPDVEEQQAAGLRLADYTRKTQAVAERERALAAKEADITAKLGMLDSAVARAETVLRGSAPDPRELAEMEAIDPGKAALAKLKHMEAQQALAVARQQRDRIAAQQAEARVTAETQRLMDAVPAFRDGDTGEFNLALYEQVGRHARKLGMDAQRWAEVIDAPLVRAVYDSMQAEAKGTKTKQVEERLKAAPKVLRPGAATPQGRAASAVADEGRARDALAKNPNNRDAAAAMFLARSRKVQGGAPRGQR